jgi:serine/threonine-protein kinase HipA
VGVATHLRAVTLTDMLRKPVDAGALRISIAGAQEKTAFLRWQDRWQLPHGTTPTTHIFKLPLGVIANRLDMRDSVENEWACMRFLRALELDAASAHVGRFQDDEGEERTLIVERFDRAVMNDPGGSAWIQRLPQEDLCQALGESPDRRYESDGGPTIEAVLGLLAAGANPDADRLTLAKAQLAFWLLAAIDGHAKNFSIFLLRNGHALAPLYDVLSAWPVIGHGVDLVPYQKAELAMSLRGDTNRTKKIGKMGIRHWRRLADASGAPHAFESMVALVERSEAALDVTERELPPGFPERVWTAIRAGVLRHRDQFLRALT